MNGWIADKPALIRLATSPDAQEWATRMQRGLVRITTATRLEIGFSSRSGTELRAATRQPPLSVMPIEYLTPAMEDRAAEVQALLADQGHHRGLSVPDLLIAAAAELSRATVLHVDKDFDLIASITAQPVERLRVP